jgi:MYXO-CTERM domain-containing protein
MSTRILDITLRPVSLTFLLLLVTIATSTICPAKAMTAIPLTPHSPISIVGNNGFTLTNGTTPGGNGSRSNPFIIQNWDITTDVGMNSKDGIQIEHTNASFIISNVYIHGQGLSNGIFFLNVTNAVVDNTTVTNSLDGITISLSNATIENSSISTNGEDGIKILDGENINLFNNILTQETGAGIYSESCVRCNLNITRNVITSNLSGVVLDSMNNSFISENKISSNQNDGVGVYSSTYVVLVLNNITDNGIGADLVTSTNNLVHHNNFVNNHAKQAFDSGTGQNMWDVGYASGGNYWSNYTGSDNCAGPNQDICSRSDGIGDTPYAFANARDNYPLKNIFVQSVIHDVAISSITPSATSVNQTGILSISVTITNEGATTENFTLTVYYDRIMIGSQVTPALTPAASQTIVFDWNTTGVPPGPHYLKAVESTVWGEVDVADNTRVAGPITVTTPPPSSPPSSKTPPQASPPSDIYAEEGIALFVLFLLLAVAAYRRRRRTR